ncbi:MAG: hypothetical protein WAL52_10790 [Candidatus Sulfotelmatobacter sp.]
MEFEKTWFQRVDRLKKTAILAAEMRYGGESGIRFRPISEITATMEKSFYPFAIADTFEIAAMKLDIG